MLKKHIYERLPVLGSVSCVEGVSGGWKDQRNFDGVDGGKVVAGVEWAAAVV